MFSQKIRRDSRKSLKFLILSFLLFCVTLSKPRLIISLGLGVSFNSTLMWNFSKKKNLILVSQELIFRPYFHQINSSLPNMKQVVLISELSIFWEQSPGLKNNLIFGEKCLKIDIKLDNMVIVSQFLLAYIIISDNIKKTSILKK